MKTGMTTSCGSGVVHMAPVQNPILVQGIPMQVHPSNDTGLTFLFWYENSYQYDESVV